MNDKEFRNEMLYQTIMSVARSMLPEGPITEEYCQIDTIFTEKYRPAYGTLLVDISLINKAAYKRENGVSVVPVACLKD